MRQWVVRLLISCGLVALVAGFYFGAILAGVPYQDATPEQEASFSFYSNLGFGLLCLGAGLLVLGLIGFIAQCWGTSD